MRSGRPVASLAGGVRGVELYTRVTLYTFVPMEGFFYLYAVAALASSEVLAVPSQLGAGLLLVAALVHIGLCLVTVHLGFGEPLRRHGRWHPAVVALLVATVAVVVLALVVLPAPAGQWFAEDPISITIGVCLAGTLGALAMSLPFRQLATLALAVPAATLVVQLTAGLGLGGAVGLGLFLYTLALFWTGTVRLSVWVLDVVRELESSRAVAARLAVAEERLRISRDMHDVVGRALSAVAVKSELSAALARRGDSRAADEMDAVHTLAQDSLREVRGVVAGYRAPDLTTEIAGARSVLRAAGIDVRVIGDVPPLDTGRLEAFAWVVREGVTNVVRHSRAGRCWIELGATGDGAVLRLTNDGVVARDGAHDGGSGLTGLRERLTAVGGTFDTTCDGERFALVARVPTTGARP